MRIVEHALAERLDQQLRERGIGLEQPAAEGDAVGLVDDARRRGRGEIVEHGLAQQIGVQRRDAVDAMRADEGEMRPCARACRRSRAISEIDASELRGR